MTKVRNPVLRGRRLEPVEWRVRDALSPFWLGWGWGRWWSLLICDEGLAAFEWHATTYWSTVLRIGFHAGVGHRPTVIDGDNWPLSERAGVVETRAALLFPREQLQTIDIKRAAIFWRRVRIVDVNGGRWVFTVADPRRVDSFAKSLSKHFGATKNGSWRRGRRCLSHERPPSRRC